MLFSSPIFLFAFLPIVLAVYYGPLRSTRRGQNLFLLIASLFFYGWAEPAFALVMVGSILLNYSLGLWAAWLRRKKKSTVPAVAVAAVCNLSLLFVFKYLTFVLANLRSLGANVPLWDIVLPVGISFFTFQALSYVLDVARGDAPCQKNPLHVGLYIAFFPQLIAGPIVKYRTVAEQIQNRRETWEHFSQGCYRFLIGLGKKVLLSNQLAVIADAAFGTGGPDSVAMAWLGSLCYTLQIFFDFGGYSDMAIGLGKMFGFQFLENFRYPYLAASPSDFWKRWHISLSTWFRDYVYIPLGGNRKGKYRTILNMFLVWLLTGIWHGANWTFILWGLTWFVALACQRLLPDRNVCLPLWLRRVLTLLLVNATWVLFRADSVGDAFSFLGTMFLWNAPPLWSVQAGYYLAQNVVVLAAAALACAPTATWLRGRLAHLSARNGLPALLNAWDALCAVATVCILLVSAAYLVKGTYNPFIYFNF
ncbi:MAG: MBOAT family protein [Oscillospiraceae bacterium]